MKRALDGFTTGLAALALGVAIVSPLAAAEEAEVSAAIKKTSMSKSAEEFVANLDELSRMQLTPEQRKAAEGVLTVDYNTWVDNLVDEAAEAQQMLEAARSTEDLNSAKVLKERLVRLKGAVVRGGFAWDTTKLTQQRTELAAASITRINQLNTARGAWSDHWGIAPGMMYLYGKAPRGSRYISGAFVNELGVVQARDDLTRISRVFPSFTGMYLPTRHLYIGGTVGFSDGKNNNGGSGFALALGLSAGIRLFGNTHFGVFAGMIHDPTIRTYAPFLEEGIPISLISQYLPSGATLLTGRDVPTRGVAGYYRSYGVALSIAVE